MAVEILTLFSLLTIMAVTPLACRDVTKDWLKLAGDGDNGDVGILTALLRAFDILRIKFSFFFSSLDLSDLCSAVVGHTFEFRIPVRVIVCNGLHR
jgi:hypothetical protein